MKLITLASAIALTAGAVQAQDVYAGVSFDYGSAKSGESQTVASLLAGATYDISTFSVGAEIEYGAAATLGGDYDTTRLRVMGGYDFGSVTGIASIGGSRFDEGADSYTGYNFGLGVQAPITNALELRGEVIQDVMSDGGTDATTTRLGAIYSF